MIEDNIKNNIPYFIFSTFVILFTLLGLILIFPYKINAAAIVKKVVIDAGHGGKDGGATANGLREATLNLDISKRISPILKGAGYTPILTRTKDVYVSLRQRVTIANNANANAFVSIHNNAGPASANGTETLYYPSSVNGKILAKYIQEEVVEETGSNNRGLKPRDNLYVLKNTNMPAALVEGGFLTNKTDAANLAKPAFRQNIAEGVANGIIRYFKGALILTKTRASVTPFSPNFDKISDSTSFIYSIAYDAKVTIKIFGGSKEVRTLIKSASRNKGLNKQAWNGLNNSGKILLNGTYRYEITAVTTKGTAYAGGYVVIKSPVPKITAAWSDPNPFSPNGDKVKDRTKLIFNISERAKVSIRVYNYKGLVKTIISNIWKNKGRNSAEWNGTSGSGKVLPNGNYKYTITAINYLYKSSVSKIVTIKR